MSKYLLVGDIHLSDRPPSSCTDTYLEDLFVILEHTVRLAEEHDVAGVVWSGDVFHHKQPSRTSHATVQRAIDIVQKYNKLWIVPGNHDMLHDRFDSISVSQPLGVLFQAGAELLQGWEKSGHPIYGIPWQQEWDPRTVIEAFDGWNRSGEGFFHPSSLVVTHAPLYPPGKEMEYEWYPLENQYPDGPDMPPFSGWSEIQGSGYCYYGHVHEDHGIYKVGNVTFANNGAITRGSLHEHNLKRSIKVTLWDPEEGFTSVAVPHKPADEVFRLMEKREVEDHQARLDEFLSDIGQTKIQFTSVEQVLQQVRAMDLGDEVVKLVEELLTAEHHGH